MAGMSCKPFIVNNTVVNNYADLGGKQIYINGDNNYAILFNNILWSESDDGLSEIELEPDKGNVLVARNNNIRGVCEGEGNKDADPEFIEGSFNLDEGSLCIGRGMDSIKVEVSWYFAPELDLYGNPRPDNSADHLVDMGAIESEFYKSIPLIMPHQWFYLDEQYTVIGTIYLDTSKWYNDSVNYTIIGGDPDPGIFEINSTTREILVTNPSRLYCSSETFDLLVQAEHSVVSGTIRDTGEIHIKNSYSCPVFNDTIYYLDPNSAAGAWVGQVHAVDPDGDVMYYEITGGNINNTFSITPAGVIRVADPDSLKCQNILTVVSKELYGPNSDTAMVTILDTVSVNCRPESVQDYNVLNNLVIYPNPANDRLNIEWPDAQSRILDVEIINITGRTIYRNTGHIEHIDVSGYARGLYFAKVRIADKIGMCKVILQ